SERGSAQLWVIAARNARVDVAESGATGDALASETVVVADLERAARFKRVNALYPGEIVVVRVDRVFRAVIGAAAPTGKAVSAEVEIQQILAAIRDIAEADFALPVDAAEDRGLGRI